MEAKKQGIELLVDREEQLIHIREGLLTARKVYSLNIYIVESLHWDTIGTPSPLGHHWGTIGTPLRHHWDTMGAPWGHH